MSELEWWSVVWAFALLQGLVLLVCVQPGAGLQPAVGQTLPSSQLGAVPPTQVPPLQVSPVVQAFPSLQGLVDRESVVSGTSVELGGGRIITKKKLGCW